MDYKNFNDYELVNYVADGNEDANNILIKKYEPLIAKIATKMLPYCKGSGIDINDLIQEGMIGLNHAIDKYIEMKDVTFYTYARACIQRKIISVVIGCNRQKNKILNESISLDDEDNLLIKILSDGKNPEQILIDTESSDALYNKIKKSLAPNEIEVFELLLNGFKYKEIAEILDRDVKSIDNTLQRIRTKVKNILKEEKDNK